MKKMRKKLIAILLTAVLGAALAGETASAAQTNSTSDKVDTSKLDIAPVAASEELEEPDDETEADSEELARSYLTGEWIDAELASKRPVAVMMGNTSDAIPQYGIGSADVIYEAPVEGELTRLMPIFQDYETLEKVMSIRSCRLYYIDWALEFDAMYIHCGQAYLAEDMLENDYVNNLSGLDGSLDGVMFFRDPEKSSPHNDYVTGESIITGIEIKDYDTEHSEDYEPHYLFNENDEEEIYPDGEDAVVVVPGYMFNKPWFVYDEETGLYNRFQYGGEQTDALTDEQVAVKNILFQIADWSVADQEAGYLEVQTVGNGDGYYVTNGKVIPVTWSKESQTEPTRYYDEDGNEITLNQGKTWVCIIQDTYADDITFYADEDEYNAAL